MTHTHLLVLLLVLISSECFSDTIRIIGEYNKRGIAKDFIVLTEELSKIGHTVEHLNYNGIENHLKKIKLVDTQIHIQNISTAIMSKGKKNYCIPNPEFTPVSSEGLQKMDLILARTKESERIFSSIGLPVFYLGFTSVDHTISQSKKSFESYIHVKGFSPLKSTAELMRAWSRYFPELIVVDHTSDVQKIPKNIYLIQEYLTDEELKFLQNRAGIHICPSKTEGFGHYLVEAMSVGSVVITTDAPPMNEFITDPRFLIPYDTVTTQNFARLYHISTEQMRNKMREIVKLDPKFLEQAGNENRTKYLEMKKIFITNLKRLFPHDA